MYTDTHESTYIHTDTQTHRHTDTQTHMHTDTQTHRHTDTHAHRHTDTHAHRHTDTQTHRHTDTQTHVYTNLYKSDTYGYQNRENDQSQGAVYSVVVPRVRVDVPKIGQVRGQVLLCRISWGCMRVGWGWGMG